MKCENCGKQTDNIFWPNSKNKYAKCGNCLTNKWSLNGEGYSYIKSLGFGEHLLKNIEGELEVWFANKNHASYGLIFKNTHLEYAHSV